MTKPKTDETATRWTLQDALDIIAMLQPMLKEINYHVLLGGGVLNNGHSDKDLDLFFIPLNNYESAAYRVMKLLHDMFGVPSSLRDSPDYHGDNMWHYREMQQYNFGGRRIDAFIQ